MTAHRITYEGPASLAMGAATSLADAPGVELTSANPPVPLEVPERVRLALTVDGETDHVTAAVRLVTDGLPPGATITVVEGT